LAVVGVLNAAIAAAYYLRIIGAMYFHAPAEAPQQQGGTGSLVAAAACAALVLAVGVYPGPVLRAARQQATVVRPAVEAMEQKNALQETFSCPHLRSISGASF
jgi:NADH-quinone oxidoreductase subunit N